MRIGRRDENGSANHRLRMHTYHWFAFRSQAIDPQMDHFLEYLWTIFKNIYEVKLLSSHLSKLELERQHQGMDRPMIRQIQGDSGE